MVAVPRTHGQVTIPLRTSLNAVHIEKMKRARLVWFAAGAACSSIAAVGADLSRRDLPKGVSWFLTMAEEWQSQSSPREDVVWRGPRLRGTV